jgi:hypothetical protein
MCTCHLDENNQFVMCNHCISQQDHRIAQQIEARNAPEAVDLHAFLTVDERDQLASDITDFFALVKARIGGSQ